MPLAVQMIDVVKRFPLVLANDHVDFDLAWGEVHALIGENGAGKSTLMKVLYGLQAADEGNILVDGREVQLRSARDAIDLGIGMVHQHFMLVETLTVAENIVLGSEPRHGPALDVRGARRKARELIERFGFDLDPDARIDELPVGLQQQVEVLKALYRQARVLIMDEPTAVLTPQETRTLFAFLRSFAADGNAVVFISHKLDEVMEVCDRMSVMRDGRMIGTVQQAETNPQQLASMMVGREVLLRVEKKEAQPGELRMEARGLSLLHPVKRKLVLDDVNLSLCAGEIVGVAGIEGNGQTELVEVLTGLRRPDDGSVWLDGRDVSELDARGRRTAGVSHVPEDRNERGLVRPYTAAWNAVLGDHHREPFANAIGLLDLGAIEAHAKRLIKAYDVRPTATEVTASSYSGGNAQKLVVARELEREPRVLIAAQPTRGVDIGAIEFIHRRLLAARDAGLAVLLVSADLNEVMSVADRIVVMYDGKIMAELSQAEATTERLGLLMAGSKPAVAAA